MFDVSKFPRVRLAFASCAFAMVLTYAAWHNQQRPRPVLQPAQTAAAAPLELTSEARPDTVPSSAMDPRPGWTEATVPQLPAALVRNEEAPTEAVLTPEPAPAEITTPPATSEVTTSSPPSPEITPPSQATAEATTSSPARTGLTMSSPPPPDVGTPSPARAQLTMSSPPTSEISAPSSARAEVATSSPARPELTASTTAPAVASIPMPRPRQRKPPATIGAATGASAAMKLR